MQGSADRTFNNCDVDNIKLSVNENSSAKYGAFSSDFMVLKFGVVICPSLLEILTWWVRLL